MNEGDPPKLFLLKTAKTKILPLRRRYSNNFQNCFITSTPSLYATFTIGNEQM